MLSRKVSMSGAMSAVVGIDRGRVGERLHAALAGLQELHLLREKQSDMVNWALRMDKDQPTSLVQTSTDCSVMGAEEERLEATLTALKQQLCRLRRQDIGLQSHLQELDQQISELKLDVSKASTEQLESDSRPSSGFYELSDGGSCSLSNSCTSVYSECLSSSSQSSLLLSPAGLAASQRPHAPPAPGDLCRRSSADEGSSQAHPPRASALHLGSSRIRAGRPVSTGDLENMLTSAPGYYRPADGKKLPPCPSVRPSVGDGRFHSSLMSRGGTEVYHYPSPLHAVALHSPLFSPGGETASPRWPEAQGPPGDGVPGTEPLGGRLGYIDKILQRSVSKSSRHSEAGGGGSPEAACLSTRPHCDWRRQCMSLQASCSPSLASSQASFRYSFPAAVRQLVCGEAATRDSGGQAAVLRAHPDRRYSDASAPGGSEEAPRVRDICPGHAGQMSHFVRAKFVPAGTQRVKVRQADRKTKAVRLRRRSSEKPRPPRPLQGCSSGERPRDGSGGYKEECRRSGAEKATQKLPVCVAEGRGLSGPGLMHAHRAPQSGPTLAKSKSRRTQCLEYKEPAEHRRRRQGAGSLPGHVEVSPAATHAHRQRSREQEQGAGSRQKQACYGSSRHHQWVGQPVSRQTSMSSSFYSNLDARYPSAAPLMSYRHPASCESEYSAECASLFHSTIAESSEGEVSDNTTNHFGDSESSQSFQSFSDSDSSLSLDEGGQGRQVQGCGEEGALVWADSALRSTRMHLQPVPRGQPPTCRIKASRALKKKIRRFQPASLKVMTLV